MKTTIGVLFLSVVVTYSGTANAAVVSASSPSTTSSTSYSTADILYDYAVYYGEPTFRWFIVWDMGNGNTIEYGSFYTEQSAFDFLAQCFFAGWEPEGYLGYEIVQREVAPVMKYLATYDKKADALALANIVQNLGFYTEIKTVSIYLRATR